MNKIGKSQIFAVVFAVVAIIIGLIAIIKLVGVAELAVGFISFTFGLMAIIWTFKARRSLSPGSELRRTTNYFMFSLIAILLFSIWDTVLGFLRVDCPVSRWFVYLKFFFITVAYFVFLRAAYEILYMSKSFGFETKAKEIKEIVKQKKKARKKKG